MSQTDPDEAFAQRLAACTADIEALLARLLATEPAEDERARPSRLVDAMRHACLGGGKRLRPFLVVESAALFSVPRARALMAGAALELVHCYSLVHDDLPAMDDDDFRRGRPTVHKAFDEATAILAGDALLTLAFDVMARSQTHPDAAVRIALVTDLARAAGVGGMAGGQMLDLAAEGRFGTETLGEVGIRALQAMKTGALIRFAARAGARLGGGEEARMAALDRYGAAVGEAFQIADDLLDLEGDPTVVGKATAKDATAGKATLVGMLGADGARKQLARCVEAAEGALSPFGERADVLAAAARFVATRRR